MDFLVHHLLDGAVRSCPRKEALAFGSERLSYAELGSRVASLAAAFRNAGIRRGDRIGIHLEHSIPQVVSILAASRAGGAFVPIPIELFPGQVDHIVRDCGVRGLVVAEAKLPGVAPVLNGAPSLDFLMVVGNAGPARGIPAVLLYDEEIRRKVPDAWTDAPIGKDLAAILYTSGSTGRPKGVMLSHEQILAGGRIVSDYLGIGADDRILSVLPLGFDAGLNQLVTGLERRATIVLETFVFAREIVETLLRERITGLAGVPTLWSVLVQPSSPLHRHSFPDLRYITNTGGRLPAIVLDSLRRALPSTRIYLMYGLTEAFRSTYLPPEELDRRPDSIGRAIPNTEIFVIDERGKPCAPGEVGELVHRGPTVSMGYWAQPELTDRVLRPHPFLPAELCSDERVCFSGDLVRADEDGFLYFVGRRDNLIKSSGHRISPTEVEEALFRSGRLREAAVIGVPDAILGETVKAFVVPNDGEEFEPDGLLACCAAELPRYMVPKRIERLEALPKTPSGKIDYPALRRKEGLA